MDELEKIRKKKMKELQERFDGKKMETEIEVGDGDFDEKVLGQSKKVPVVVDFWASWCAPCLMLGPTLEKLAKEYNGRFILAKLNVDNSPAISQRYGIMSIPCVKMFKGGELADEFIGVMPEGAVRQWLDKNLNG
jgi:putative thioredoxin